MKAPDVIYVEFSDEVNLAFEQQPFEETPAYIRKDALMKWLEECMNNPVITDLQKDNIQELIDKINSL